jgi:NAD(P)-dependent dehydrogenase (short-subunit alcohol dehydrogenase family)
MHVLRVNLAGVVLCTREAVKRMSTRHGGAGGAIVNVSSIGAVTGSPHAFTDYAAAKGGVDTLTIGVAAEVANCGIRVNAVRPGMIDTDIHASAGMPDRVARFAASLPIGRAAAPREVAEAICFLLSPQASYITGAILDVAGGVR